jgi:hypothetical protein
MMMSLHKLICAVNFVFVVKTYMLLVNTHTHTHVDFTTSISILEMIPVMCMHIGQSLLRDTTSYLVPKVGVK